MRTLLFVALLCLTQSAVTAADDATAGYLYVFFRDPGSAGLCFALSTDGYHWRSLNHDQPLLRPVGAGGHTRDPFIARGPAGGFHLVWTADGKIGYRHSRDLVNWTEPKLFTPFAREIPVQNVWAPELVWDSADREWIVIWSSTITGAFPETNGQVDHDRNHRIYAATTKDFVSLSTPFVYLDPGFPVIDATVVEVKNRWALVIKDERDRPLRKRIQIAFSATPRGPWGPLSPPLTPEWTEGPSLLQVNDGWLLYYDYYRGPTKGMHALHTTDGEHFDDASSRLQMPLGSKHGGFIRLTAEEYARLKRAFDETKS